MSFSSYGQSGPIFLSANVVCFVMLGILHASVQNRFSWGYWCMAMAVWGIVFFIGTYISIWLLYRPNTDFEVSGKYINELRESMGKISRGEKITSAVLFLCLSLWVLEPLHGISIAVVSIAGALLLFGVGILDKYDLRNEIPWESLFFIGAILNLGYCLPELKIDAWMGSIIIPVIQNFSGPCALALLLTIIVIIARFFLVSQNATMILFMAMLLPLANHLGINPWVLGMIIFSAMQTWHTKYQNFTFIPALAMVTDTVDYKDTVKMSFAYSIYTLAGILLSIPYWVHLGLIYR
jgi:di/tricarboxylate transporter